MNRELKLRAWHTAHKRMCPHTELVVHNRWKLMQYIGVKDKNGKEVYGGDILKITRYPQSLYKVEYSPPDFCLFDGSKDGNLGEFTWKDFETSEVVGNIYENPELLEE